MHSSTMTDSRTVIDVCGCFKLAWHTIGSAAWLWLMGADAICVGCSPAVRSFWMTLRSSRRRFQAPLTRSALEKDQGSQLCVMFICRQACCGVAE